MHIPGSRYRVQKNKKHRRRGSIRSIWARSEVSIATATPNVLTIDKGTSRLAQSTSAQTALVEIERYDGELPAITVFTQPAMV